VIGSELSLWICSEFACSHQISYSFCAINDQPIWFIISHMESHCNLNLNFLCVARSRSVLHGFDSCFSSIAYSLYYLIIMYWMDLFRWKYLCNLITLKTLFRHRSMH
jgi:hypothetical protein